MNKVIASYSETLFKAALIFKCSDKDDGEVYVARILLYFGGSLKAIHYGHFAIHKNQIDITKMLTIIVHRLQTVFHTMVLHA